MERFCADLKDHATEIIIYGKKEILPLTDEDIESYSNQKFCHICQKKFYDVNDTDDNGNNGYDYDLDDDLFDVRKVHGNVVQPDIDIDYYDDDLFDAREVHGNVAESETDIDDDYGNYDDGDDNLFDIRIVHGHTVEPDTDMMMVMI